ncbi:MAG: Cys-Gln thioester bond-forming surface protein [Clostridia bacterium]
MKLIKKIVVSIIVMLLALAMGTSVFAATTPVTFGLSEYRRETNGKQYGYRINNGNKRVWKVIVYENDGTTMNFDNTIYCLKAEKGFYTATPNSFKQTYDKMVDFADKASLVPTIFENDDYYYAATWILDHAYIPYYAKSGDSVEVQSQKTEQAAQDREDLLNAAGMSDSLKQELTDDDIDVVQQMALWYFTNTKAEENSDIYHVDFAGEPSFQEIAIAEKGVGSYTTMSDVNETRADAMEKLYQYMVKTAKSTENIEYYKTHNGKVEEPITLDSTLNPTVELDGSNYIVGPYKINKNNDLPFELNAKFTDQNGTDLNGKYTLLNSSKQAVAQGTTIKDLVGQSFYISIPSSNIDDITKIKFSYTGSYRTSSKGFWTTTQNPDTVQPLVAVEKQETPLSGEKEVGVAKREFDLALRKFISEVNGKEINREPIVDVSNLNKMVDGAKITTATYNHNKKPVAVKPGDIVTYTIRVYNEGELDGYVGEITDYLPAELEFINDVENYPEETDFNAGYGWKIDASNNRVIKTNKLAYSSEAADRDQNASNLIKAYNGTTLDYKEVKVKCRVKNSTESLKKITNLAQITQETDSKGGAVTDRDSVPNGNFTLPSDTDLPTYKDDEINSEKQYIPGQEDDDDFEKVIIQEFDLALRKFISGKNGTTLIGREPSVDVTNLANGTATTATYNHPKKAVDMARGDVVEYTIRVYNEGSIDGYANKIVDKLPAELEFLPENETNIQYGWQVSEDGRTVTTDYLSEARGGIPVSTATTSNQNLIKAFDGTTLSYKDVKIVCKVKDTAEFGKKLTNLAEITEAKDSEGNDVIDRDSETNNMQVPSDEDLPAYKDDEINNEYVPGQEDDDDFEKVRVVYFDLALRKFITAVDDQEVTTRVPQLSIGEDGNIKYDHTKDPVEVENGDVVTYTIRIYNEGLIDGYATEVKDDIPDGLKFLPDNPINREYRWQESEDGQSVTTDYLSKAQEENDGDNLIKAYDPEKGLTESNPDYRDVKIAFQVTEPNTSDRILVNTAEIADDSDSSGDPIDDIDSTPDNNNEWNEEDDLDKEFVKVKYFDLALKKWVSKAIIIDADGTQTVQETGHTGDEDPEPPAKVDLGRRDINKVTVKFEFQIKITNEGEIAGYAKEITDYIPEGLRFVQEDNPDWYTREPLNGRERVATKLLENTLLQPGESATVSILLTWINGQDNMGLKTNIAEISQDYNDSNTPDIDSVPDNFKEDEDDIDDAPVMLTVALGDAKLYIGIAALVVIALGGGVFIIKKYVI